MSEINKKFNKNKYEIFLNNKEEIIKLHEEGKTYLQIIKMLNLPIKRTVLSRYLKNEGYDTSRKIFNIDYNTLYKKYITEKKSTHKIAKEYNVHSPDIIRLLKKHKIKTRTYSEAIRMEYGHKFIRYGYVFIKIEKHPFAVGEYAKEHRLVMENYLKEYEPNHYALIEIDNYDGKWLNPKYVVHHINRIRDDNRVENLQIMTIEEHLKEHENDKLNGIISKKLNKTINNKSKDKIIKYKGASFKKPAWISSIWINGKYFYLGRFKTEKEASFKYYEIKYNLFGFDYMKKDEIKQYNELLNYIKGENI